MSAFDANVRAVFLCQRYQLPVMLAQGAGRIVLRQFSALPQ